jgi:hypothetical protein
MLRRGWKLVVLASLACRSKAPARKGEARALNFSREEKN